MSLKLVEVEDDLVFFEPEKGHAVTTDTAALFLYFKTYLKKKLPAGNVLDIGSGSGSLTLVLAFYFSGLAVYGIDIQKKLHELALNNSASNKLAVNYTLGDIREAEKYYQKEFFDVIFANPPFFKVGEGKISTDIQRALARHEIKLKMSDLFKAVNYLLKKSGSAILVYPSQRAQEILENIRKYDLSLVESVLIEQNEKGITFSQTDICGSNDLKEYSPRTLLVEVRK